MQISLPKIATVILAIAAVSFMGMAVASYYGRPDPIAEMHSPEIIDYRFEAQPGAEGTKWTVTPSVGKDQDSKQKDTAYAALLEAYTHKAARISAQTDAMTELTTELRENIDRLRTEQVLDTNAIDARIDALRAQVAEDEAALLEKSQRLQKLSVDTRVVRDETTRRREDVARLQSNLVELRTDRFRLVQQRLVLTDRLLRLQLQNQAIAVRLQQLDAQTP